MTIFVSFVAATLGVPTALATTVVNLVMGAGTLLTILGILATIVSSGATALMTMGWATFKSTVVRLAKSSMAKAVAW